MLGDSPAPPTLSDPATPGMVSSVNRRLDPVVVAEETAPVGGGESEGGGEDWRWPWPAGARLDGGGITRIEPGQFFDWMAGRGPRCPSVWSGGQALDAVFNQVVRSRAQLLGAVVCSK